MNHYTLRGLIALSLALAVATAVGCTKPVAFADVFPAVAKPVAKKHLAYKQVKAGRLLVVCE